MGKSALGDFIFLFRTALRDLLGFTSSPVEPFLYISSVKIAEQGAGTNAHAAADGSAAVMHPAGQAARQQ